MTSITVTVNTAGAVSMVTAGSLVEGTVPNIKTKGAIQTRGERIEMLSLEELPFTGHDPLFKVIGGALILAGLPAPLYILKTKKAIDPVPK